MQYKKFIQLYPILSQSIRINFQVLILSAEHSFIAAKV